MLSVIELLFLSLTVEALQGKMCQDSVGAKISGEGVVSGEYFLVSTKLDTSASSSTNDCPSPQSPSSGNVPPSDQLPKFQLPHDTPTPDVRDVWAAV